MAYTVGSLVRARGREWVVLPQTTEDLLVVRPLGGAGAERTGIVLAPGGRSAPGYEVVASATFSPPTPDQLGDAHSAALLRDAMRLGFRSSAGPFRSFGHLGVEPRPYQLVPLLMALRLEPVRLLIADDVGIGKTIEAGLILRELMDRGELDRFTVLCPPALAEQWQRELAEKFYINAELVLPSTAARLERSLGANESIFSVHPFTIVSMDFIKSEKRREDFLLQCPDMVIVDEAHTCASGQQRSAAHQRYDLLKRLARKRERSLLLLTATPHSGDEHAFRALLGLLDDKFSDIPDDLTTETRREVREALARQMVQRRRGDIRQYLGAETSFPARVEADVAYALSPAHHDLLREAIAFARETVRDQSGQRHRQRIRYWSALALLRCIASSPAAAAATLRTRAASASAPAEEADEVGRQTVLDLVEADAAEATDVPPGSESDADDLRPSDKKRLLAMASAADALAANPADDRKLQELVKVVKGLLKDGFNPIIFCRYIPTAGYVAEALGKALKGTHVEAVTGLLPPSEREDRVARLGEHASRVLVATDCLSEGINLQERFDAVVHYDLSWNPTRHEQREGRVDRFGQARPEVRAVTLYGKDNQIDGIVLDVLLRKHKAIRSALGISVPVPASSNDVLEAIFESLFLHHSARAEQLAFEGWDTSPKQLSLDQAWTAAEDREKRSRSIFAQASISPDEVYTELRAAADATGDAATVRAFTHQALARLGAQVSERAGGLRIDLGPADHEVLDLAPDLAKKPFTATFDPSGAGGDVYLSRTHPLVEGLARTVLDAALDGVTESPAARCGVMRTQAVAIRTTLLLLRLRFHLGARDQERKLLAEDWALAAFAGSPDQARWLGDDEAQRLLGAEPSGNMLPEVQRAQVGRILDGLGAVEAHIETLAREKAEALRAAHLRMRSAAGLSRAQVTVEPVLPVDALGVYVLLPMGGQA